jgi:hypothetical protein
MRGIGIDSLKVVDHLLCCVERLSYIVGERFTLEQLPELLQSCGSL